MSKEKIIMGALITVLIGHCLNDYGKRTRRGEINSVVEYFTKDRLEDIRRKSLEKYVEEYWKKRKYPPKTYIYKDKDGIKRKCKRYEWMEDPYSYDFSKDYDAAIVEGRYWYRDKYKRTLDKVKIKEEYIFTKNKWKFKRIIKQK